jgi:hypothetical protein
LATFGSASNVIKEVSKRLNVGEKDVREDAFAKFALEVDAGSMMRAIEIMRQGSDRDVKRAAGIAKFLSAVDKRVSYEDYKRLS